MNLADLCKFEGYTLVIDADPCGRSDAVGSSLPHGGLAQLCEHKVIAVPHDGLTVYYAVTHEIAHDRKGYPPVKASVVLEEQIQILLRWTGRLLDYLKDPEWAAGPSRSIKDIVAGLPALQITSKVSHLLRGLEPGMVVLASWVAEQVGVDDVKDAMAVNLEDRIIVPVYSLRSEPPAWTLELSDLGPSTKCSPDQILVGFKRV